MRSLPLLILAIPSLVVAQNPQGMSEADMQRMMQQMQQVQACMQNVDQSELQVLQQRAQQLDGEIKALCAQGKRAEAESTALAFAREMESKPALQQMKKCSAMMPDMSHMMPMPYPSPEQAASKDSHICD